MLEWLCQLKLGVRTRVKLSIAPYNAVDLRVRSTLLTGFVGKFGRMRGTRHGKFLDISSSVSGTATTAYNTVRMLRHANMACMLKSNR
jgi:hypothetical protein